MNGKTALILGASGLTGQHCLYILLNDGVYSKVIALVRRRLDVDNPMLQQEVVDFVVTGTMEKFYEGVDDVFCCLGTDLKNAGSASTLRRVNFHIPVEAANIASEHGVKQFLVVSTPGADNHSSDLYIRVKGEMEKGLKQFSFAALHVFRPPEVNPTENISDNNEGFLKRLFGSAGRASNSGSTSIAAETLARAMVNAAQSNKEGNFYYNSKQIMDLSQEKGSIGKNQDSLMAEM